MSTINTAGTGPSSVGGTFVGGVIPGPGDVVMIQGGHVLTNDLPDWKVTSIHTVASDTNQFRNAGKITVTANCVWGGRGSTPVKTDFVPLPGSEWVFDTGVGNTLVMMFGSVYNSLSKMEGGGEEFNRAIFRQIGTGQAGFAYEGLYNGYWDLQFTNFIGLTQDPLVNPNTALDLPGSGNLFTKCEFDGCGEVLMSAGGASAAAIPWGLDQCTFKNGISASGYDYRVGAGASTIAKLLGNVSQRQTYIIENALTVEDNIFLDLAACQITQRAASWTRNWFSRPEGPMHQTSSDEIENIFWLRTLGNDHGIGWPGLFNKEVRSCLWMFEGENNQGDPFQGPNITPSSPLTCTFHYNLLPPGSNAPSGDSAAGGLFSVSRTAANARFIIEHNTMHVSVTGGVLLGEGSFPGSAYGYAGQGRYMSNIAWSRSPAPPASCCHITMDPGNVPPSGDEFTDWAFPVDCDYNLGHGLSAGLRGGGYDFPGSGALGVHDVSGDPMFVDEGRDFVDWAQEIDPSITTVAGVVALLLTKNDDGADPRINTENARLKIFEAYAPTNPIVVGAAHDGTFIGAVPFTSGDPSDSGGVSVDDSGDDIMNRKYATATVAGTHILRRVYLADGSAIATDADWEPDPADVSYIKDGVDAGGVSLLPQYVGYGWWAFRHTAGELTGKTMSVTASNPLIRDVSYSIETFGNVNAFWQDDLASETPAPPTEAEITDALLDELTAGHLIAGSVGKALVDALAAAVAAQSAAATAATAAGVAATSAGTASTAATAAASSAGTAATAAGTAATQTTPANIRAAVGLTSANLGTTLTGLPAATADAYLLRDVQSGAAGAPGERVMDALAGGFAIFDTTGDVLTVYFGDGTSVAYTRPITRSAADPIQKTV